MLWVIACEVFQITPIVKLWIPFLETALCFREQYHRRDKKNGSCQYQELANALELAIEYSPHELSCDTIVDLLLVRLPQ